MGNNGSAEALTSYAAAHHQWGAAVRSTVVAVHSVLESECLGNQVFRTLAEAYDAVAQWITFYNERRMHGSLDDWPPAVFYRWVMADTAPAIKAVHC